MGARRSLWRVSVWLPAVVCALLAFAPSAAGETREVGVRDELLPTELRTFFLDPVSGNSITTIVAGDGVRWRWGNTPLTVTLDFHSVKSGVCTPESCTGIGDGLWNSELTTSDPIGGVFTRGPGTFGTAFTSGTATPLTAPFQTAGTYQYFCGFHGSLMNGTIIVLPAALHHFDVTGAPATVTAGQPFIVTLAARDQFNNLKTNYTGTVTFSASNPHPSGGEVPANYTFVSGDQGDRNFTFTLKTAGSRTITIQDGAIQRQFTVTVNPAATNQLTLTNVPATVAAGTSFQVTVTARDQFSNVTPGYGGTVHFTSSDGAATLPADNTLISGTRNFNVTLATAGVRSLTVTDTVNSALTATANINVNVACGITFSNPAPITITDLAAGSPYPSMINVAGLQQTVNGMSVTFTGLNHQFGLDTDILLVAPNGAKMVVLSDAGGNFTASNVTITLSDAAASLLPSDQVLVSGTFKPTNYSIVADSFPAPAPGGPYAEAAPTGSATLGSTFNGINPNGTWSLYVSDFVGGGSGNITGGWSITFAPPARTFCNQNNIAIPVGGASTPYPSNLDVSGLDGTIRNLSMRFDKLTHPFPVDLDMLLVSPTGQKMVVMSDAGGGGAGSDLVFTLADSAAAAVPEPLVSGVFRPTSLGVAGSDSFPATGTPPPPSPPYLEPPPASTATLASGFGGSNPNGTWRLYIFDDVNADAGTLAGGWALTFDLIFNTTTTMSSTINPSVVGEITIIRTNVTSSGPGTPTGTVSYTLNGAPFGSAGLGTDGGAAFGFQPIAGTYNLTATYSGDANFNPSVSNILVQVVNPGPTTTSLGSSLNPSTFGQSVTFTATVSESTPYSPTGTVTFRDGAATIGTGTVNAGQATFTTSALVAGAHSITAVYNGDSNFLTSTSTVLTQTVNKANTTTAVVTSGTPSTFGNSVTFTATVSDSTSSVPTGTVTFRNGLTTLGTGTLNASGVATFSTSALSAGSHTNINAVYAGDANFNGSTAPGITQTVNKRTPTASVISFLNPSVVGDEVIFRADVSATVTPPAAAPTGTVSFKDGIATLSTIALSSGTAQFSISTLVGGSHNITAVYNGDGNYNTQTSAVLVQEVTPAETSTGLGSSLNPSTFGQPVIFTATVTSGLGPPAGTVTFMDGATSLGTETLNGLGIATFTTPSLSAGSHSITAIYNGNGSFASSVSSVVMQNVNQSATTMAVSAPKETSVFREAVTFTVTVSSTTSGTPTGTVTFFDGATNLGAALLNGVGEAAITVSGLPVGKHEISVQYAGDSNFPANTSAPLVHYRSPRPR